eukprot:6181631-Pleurochrysis_carterae.AAC.1
MQTAKVGKARTKSGGTVSAEVCDVEYQDCVLPCKHSVADHCTPVHDSKETVQHGKHVRTDPAKRTHSQTGKEVNDVNAALTYIVMHVTERARRSMQQWQQLPVHIIGECKAKESC